MAPIENSEDIESLRVRAAIEARLFQQVTAAHPLALGRYQIKEKLGMGGMGIVYRAYDPELERWIALKVMNERNLAPQAKPQAQKRLIHEAKSMAKLTHPNIVQIYDVGTFAEQVFIAMELVEGSNLHSWIDHKNPPWHEIISLFLQAGEALAAAHQMGVVHRDFKPENVLVSVDGRVKVLDFGLCRVLDASNGETQNQQVSALSIHEVAENFVSLTQTGALIGTPHYMSPEQILGKNVDIRTDQFSFCIALYEAVYRQTAFAGRELCEYLEHVIAANLRPPPPQTDVPPWMWPILAQGLANNPEHRFPSMQALLTEIQAYLANEVSERKLPKNYTSGLSIQRFGQIIAFLGIAIAFYYGYFFLGFAPMRSFMTIHAELIPAKIPVPAKLPQKEIHEDSTSDLVQVSSSMNQPHQAFAQDWCYMHEDHYTLIKRSNKREHFIRDSQGKCYQCRLERRVSRIQRFRPDDCQNYQVCQSVEQDLCR